jgi:hypothetical protein
LIRDSEVCVEELKTPNVPDNDATSHSKRLTAYVQAQIDWARLWALVWDTFFSTRMSKQSPTHEEIEVIDARILHIRRELPPWVTWETSRLEEYVSSQETDQEIRSRLVIFVVCRPTTPKVFYPDDEPISEK